MTQITLDRETAERLRAAGSAQLLDPDGVMFATLTPLPPVDPQSLMVEDPDVWTEEEIAEAKRRLAEGNPGIPAEDAYRNVFGENWRERYGLVEP